MLKKFILAMLLFSPSHFAFCESELTSVNTLYESLNTEERKLYREAADELRCPTCTGLSVLQSEASFSLQIRRALLEQIKEKKSYDEIMSFFTKRYGLWILRKPPTQGFHLLAWAFPILIIFIVFLLILWNFWRKSESSQTFGVRKSIDILTQMEKELSLLRNKRG